MVARMATDVRMPRLSDNMEAGLIVRWMKAPGDPVAKGEPLAEVETDKADVELEASDSGVLREIIVPEGQSAAVGAVIARLGQGDEAAAPAGRPAPAAETKQPAAVESKPAAAADKPRPAGGVAPKAEAQKPPAASPAKAAARSAGDGARMAAPGAAAPAAEPKRAAPAESAPPRGPAEARPSGAVEPPSRVAPARTGVRASPLAVRFAEEKGIDLTAVRGSGPGGRILRRDVESVVRATQPLPAEEGARAEGSATAVTPSGRLEPVSRMRQAIARRMSEAKRDIPHFYVTAEIDMSEVMHLRESIRRREAMPGLTVTHLLLRALAIALQRHPNVNASWHDGAIELHDDVNLGIAVAVDDGLVVPVLHRAQLLTLGELAERAGELTEKARQGRFGSDDLTGSTFSLSNVGMLDVEELTAVINPPNAAILAVGAVKDRPIARDGQLAIAKTMRATLSCDHRVLNGLEGGRFLEELKSILENPVTLLLE